MAVMPKPASTVILTRDTPDGELEMFLLKRHEASAFMGGNFVYPGGRRETADGDKSILPYSSGFPAAAACLTETEEQEELGYLVCAIRELYEEAGILLAYDRSGQLLELENVTDRERFSAYRSSVDRKEMSLADLAQREGICYALDQLFFLDRWITPEARNIRFDTRFYLAFCPRRQEASPDRVETTRGVWLSPGKALDANLAGSIALSPPTLETLEELSPFRDRNSMLRFLSERTPRTVLPILIKDTRGQLLVFPWDEEYQALQTGSLAHPRPSRQRMSREKTSRLLLQDGRWLPCRPEE